MQFVVCVACGLFALASGFIGELTALKVLSISIGTISMMIGLVGLLGVAAGKWGR